MGGALVLSLGISAAQAASASGPNWSTASSIPGLEGSTGLNVGGLAQVSAISCSSAGNCSEGGSYYDASNEYVPFVATETSGSWSAQAVPGIGALDTQGDGAEILSLSCSSAGNCAAGGYYHDANFHQHGFLVDELGGVWQSAQSPATLLSLNQSSLSEVSSVSCSSDGACAAVGYYDDQYDNSQGFVASEVNGTWTADAVPSLIALNAEADHGGNGRVSFTSLSCSSANYCDAVGYYTDGNDNYQGFVASEVNATWTAYAVPSLIALNDAMNNGVPGGSAFFNSVSCWSAGNCAAGGTYLDGNSYDQGFVATEVNGTWTAYDVPTLDTLNAGAYAAISDVSCSTDGSCTAVGTYRDASNEAEGFYLTFSGGAWGPTVPIAGLSSLNTYGYVSQLVVSCGSAGTCAIGGSVEDQQSNFYNGTDAFVASESDGSWSDALLVPGLQTLNTQEDSSVTAISCAADGSCLAGGTYRVAAGNDGLEFVTSTAPAPAPAPAPPSSSGGATSSVTGLVSIEVSGSITASWSPASGATSYTCTLLYAMDDPSTFSTTTTSTTCSFNGLSTDASYGVRVVANDGGVSSAFTDTYASYSSPVAVTTTIPNGAPAATGSPKPKPRPKPKAKATSIVCVKGKIAKRIRAVNPRCPAGYHRRAG